MAKTDGKRTDTASRVIKAQPSAIYQAFINPEAWVAWLPPQGMSGQIQEFDPRPGGLYRMTLTYLDPANAGQGKTSELSDVIRGKFLEFVPDRKIVQGVEFVSDDPGFAEPMTMTWMIEAAPEGSDVTIVAQNVPSGISPEDHQAGMQSTLENLARFTERD